MVSALLSAGIQYTGYFLEVALFAYVILFGHARRLLGVTILLGSYVAIDCAIRPYTLHFHDLQSKQYSSVYWLTDVVLTLEWFGVICFFFRRAFQHRPEEWHRMRLMLVWAFVLVMSISCISVYRNYRHLQ